MPQHDLPLIIVTQHLGDLHLGEGILFPEVLVLHEKEERLRSMVRGLAKSLLGDAPPIEVHRRLMGQTPEVLQVSMTISPPEKSVAWSEAVTLRVDYLRWRHGEEGWIGFVPALGIQVVAGREEQLEEMVLRHIRAALLRSGAAERLFDLAQLARVDSITVEREEISADIQTPAEIAAERSKKEESAKLVIEEVGTVLNEKDTARAYEMDGVVNRLAEMLSGPVASSVLLVGPSGVGKTAAFGELFHQRREFRLGSAPFWVTSGSRLIAGTSGFGVWQERCQKLCRQAKRDGAILHLGNLVELMEVGKAGGSQFGIASFFRPFIARRDVLVVVECTLEQLPVIEKSHPHLLGAFGQILMEEAGDDSILKILSCVVEEVSGGGVVSEGALDAVVRLHRRYGAYSVFPGRALRFLKNLLADRKTLSQGIGHGPQAGRLNKINAISAGEVMAAFSRETGLPLFLLDEGVPLELDSARGHFAGRVIGQEQAVDLVTDLLATVKASLNRPRRPIASLLFIGPTGVGKTEMAKALADYFFGGAGSAPPSAVAPPSSSSPRLVRFDMSEFSSPAAVARLVGTAWETEGLLTSKIREEPFCVLLLDEFEKAHPSFFDLLLQVLGEGRLTDSAGRLADFSNAIVVMTSNLGAGSFGSGPFGLSRAGSSGREQAREHFTHAVQSFLRPELFNRIDRIVPFLPLEQETIRHISQREIELITRRDGIRQRDLSLTVSPAAIDQLACAGYDPLYGVRPLKRRIEQDLLSPLADAANQYGFDVPLSAQVDWVKDKISVLVRGRNIRAKGDEATHSPSSILHPASSFSLLRRRLQAIARCPAAVSLSNELFTMQRVVNRKAAQGGRRMADPLQRERLKRLQAIYDAQVRLTGEVTALEDAVLLNLYEAAPLSYGQTELAERLGQLDAGVQRLLLDLYSLGQPDPHVIALGLYGNAPAELFALAEAYHDIVEAESAAEIPAAISVGYYTRLGKSSLQRTTVAQKEIADFFASPRAGVHGIVLAIRAGFARARFETEAGLHVIEEDKSKNQRPILVDAWPLSAADYRPPKDVEFRIALAGQRRRTYTLERHELDDRATNKSYRWSGRSFAPALLAAIEEDLRRRAEALLE